MISRLMKEFADDTTKPCSVFGTQRKFLFRSFYFCDNCDLADRMQQSKPQLKLNRRTVNGKYTCQAHHTEFGFPTHRLDEEEEEDEEEDGKEDSANKQKNLVQSDQPCKKVRSNTTEEVAPVAVAASNNDVNYNKTDDSSLDSIFLESSDDDDLTSATQPRTVEKVSVGTQTEGLIDPMSFRHVPSTVPTENSNHDTELSRLKQTNDSLQSVVDVMKIEVRDLKRTIKAHENES